MIALRKKYQVVVDGSYSNFNSDDSDVYGYTRTNATEQLVVICSFSNEKVNYEIPSELQGGELILSNYEHVNLHLENKLVLRPYETAVYYRRSK